MDNKSRVNRLIDEKSPYLLQHAHNPVDWHPWNNEAFEKAVKEDKPIFLSIGYSTCHWCHVMEKESFEDPEIVRLLNDGFVSIKVDREERPDIDNIYMKACQIMTGSGGWPLSIFMTSDRKPFFASTYIPKDSRFGRIGLKELIPRIRKLWITNKKMMTDSAEKMNQRLKELLELKGSSKRLEESILDEAFVYLSSNFDELNGGFGKAPKFPTPHHISFLLHYWKRKQFKEALFMAEKTLQNIRKGGIYDHIGYGFHRYSTDAEWIVPHFEKMLYDQAMLSITYLEAFLATKNEIYEKTAREILTYVLEKMTDFQGGFYSAEDADSEGEEGKFYVWTEDELKKILPKKNIEFILDFYNVKKKGNFTDELSKSPNGLNILYTRNSIQKTSNKFGMSVEQAKKSLEKCRSILLEHRETRIHPSKDDKILLDWNGLMIAAFAKAGGIFNDDIYVSAAKKATDFILKNMMSPDGLLFHRYREGEAAIPAFLDDYSFFIFGLLELYETTFEFRYLKNAVYLVRKMIKLFWDNEGGGFTFSVRNEDNQLQQKTIYDGAYPSGNSIAALVLTKISHITGDDELENKASQLFHTFSEV